MKLKPAQMVGLVAVIVFGGYLIYTLAKPKPDPFVVPGAATLQTTQSPLDANLPAGDQAALESPPNEPPPEIEQPLAVGSQDARDDLYCSGLLFAANPPPAQALLPADEGRRYKAQMQALSLVESGTQRLVTEGVAVRSQAGQVADAWAEVAARDLDAGAPKISLEECAGRADALPPIQ